jgi:adenylate kinase family enzyme
VKIHIVGLPSSGKTTLARGLSSYLGVPHHDLDSSAYVDGRWTLRPVAEREESLSHILTSPGFVTEGHFVGWVTPFCAAADRIVWLDPPLWVLVWRHVRRHGWPFKPQWLIARLRFQVLCYIRPVGRSPAKNDPDLTRSGIEEMLGPWAQKVLRLRHPASVAEVIEKLGPDTSA